jgi:hypothetical protein
MKLFNLIRALTVAYTVTSVFWFFFSLSAHMIQEGYKPSFMTMLIGPWVYLPFIFSYNVIVGSIISMCIPLQFPIYYELYDRYEAKKKLKK